jgi:hypothetical protein
VVPIREMLVDPILICGAARMYMEKPDRTFPRGGRLKKKKGTSLNINGVWVI